MTGTKEPVIWVIDSQQWPRAYLRAELLERGYNAIGFASVTQALAALNLGKYPGPWAIVLELFALEAEGREIATLVDHGIPTILLGGAAQLNEGWIKGLEWYAVMRRPFTIGQVVDKIAKLTGSDLSI